MIRPRRIFGGRSAPIKIKISTQTSRNQTPVANMSMVDTHIFQSAVVPAPLQTVWKHIRSMNFSWWSLVDKTSCDGPTDRVGSTHTLMYKDGSKWTVWSCLCFSQNYFFNDSNALFLNPQAKRALGYEAELGGYFYRILPYPCLRY
jgi:hypothetical protein